MAQRPVAIIGMASRFPQSDGVQSYWQALIAGKDCIGTVPQERWDSSYFAGSKSGEAGRTYCSAVGMDDTGDCYDAAFFGIDAAEVRGMDPQQGRVLELAWHACEDAGILPDSLAGKEVGVFLGVSTRDFDRRMSGIWQHINFHTSTGASGAIIANRLSYLFGLTGPSIAVDTACASSLASVHLACMAIENEECDLAFAGGVQLILSPANIIAFAQAGLLAKDGRCKPFSANADGYVCGEGAGLLLLKPLDLALRDGDRIRAVIRGSAINHNGRSNGLSAPYRAGQQQVIRKALDRAGISPVSIGYVEAHAPGTLIGDTIEFQAIRDIYGANRPNDNPCFVGSVKSNIGHLEAAAGVAALIKAALIVERGVLPASLHCSPSNALLKSEKGPLHLCETTQIWPESNAPRLAGVSAFSFGGANAHVIIEQPPAMKHKPSDTATGPWLLFVSARCSDALERLCDLYAEHLVEMRNSGVPLEALRDFCCTTLAHRQHHAWRRAFVVRNWNDATENLRLSPSIQPSKRRFCIGFNPSEFEANNDAALFPFVAILAHIGLKRIHIVDQGASSFFAQLAAVSEQAGLKVLSGATPPPNISDCLSIADASACEETSDFLWGHSSDFLLQSTMLFAQLFERGFQLRWQGFAERSRFQRACLPLYPFQRRRNHVIPDELPVGNTGEGASGLSSPCFLKAAS